MPLTETNIALNVPFSQKDSAKALGAKFDFDNKVWYVPAGLDIRPFERWMPNGTRTAATEINLFEADIPLMDKPFVQNTDHLTLSGILNKVAGLIKGKFTEAYWIQLEVSKFNNRGQHAYFDFVEYDGQGKEIAKARGALWAGTKNVLLNKFKTATGSDIQDGMKLLLKLSVEFSGQYGLSFVLEDIDPSYTLGDMEAKLKAIREALIKANLFDLNKKLPKPVEFTRVAVISPEGAAGLADFMREADIVHAARLCRFVYYTATFQGKESAKSLTTALEKMHQDHAREAYDALVIIRGGGASSDLAWLNDYDLAALVCKTPIPVLTGIGHQIDDTILDEVAHMRFDTPSKVSAFIAGVIVDNATAAIKNIESIIKDARQAIDIANQKLDIAINGIKTDSEQSILCYESQLMANITSINTSSKQTITRYESQLDTSMIGIQTQSLQTIAKYESNLDSYLQTASSGFDKSVAVIENSLNTMMMRIGDSARSSLELTSRELTGMISEVIGLSPQKTLARGYALIRAADGKVLTSAEKISQHGQVEIEMHDGRVTFERQGK